LDAGFRIHEINKCCGNGYGRVDSVL
jgi:hypothetical protein